jgi:hypothetical protein
MDHPTAPTTAETLADLKAVGDRMGTSALGGPELPEIKADPLSLIAVDANALAGAIWSGQGTDVSKLISDLLRERPAA